MRIANGCAMRSFPESYDRVAGYSLIEAMVIVAVIAIVLSIAIPSYAAMTARTRLRAAADHLRSDLSEARTQALQRGQPVYLSFSRSADGATWCWGMSLQSGCDCTQQDESSSRYCYLDIDAARSPPRRLSRVVDSRRYAQVRLDALPFGGVLRLSPVRPETLAGNASFSARGQSLRLVASRSGRLRLCSPRGTQYLAGVPTC
jgi:type IV fimbrial biogenesis protein FimT